uniref:DUF4199 domain-containing protein n=1 Tax=Roseihalotalea indica TaxID=2867963 RepID=A0AA49JEU3_9BACT|nr:DUF4199 domain-containing protein [Tunicatimonas sp. TK19036]
MSDQPKPARAILQVGVKYGLVGSVIGIGLFFAMRWLGENPMIWTSPKLIAYCVLFAVFSLLAILEFRRYHLIGKWKFWQGLALGVLVYSVISLTTFLVSAITMQFDPDMLQSYREVSIQSLETNREGFIEQFGEERYAETKEVVMVTTLWDVALDDLFKKMLIGFFLTVTIVLAISIISSLQAREPSK